MGGVQWVKKMVPAGTRARRYCLVSLKFATTPIPHPIPSRRPRCRNLVVAVGGCSGWCAVGKKKRRLLGFELGAIARYSSILPPPQSPIPSNLLIFQDIQLPPSGKNLSQWVKKMVSAGTRARRYCLVSLKFATTPIPHPIPSRRPRCRNLVVAVGGCSGWCAVGKKKRRLLGFELGAIARYSTTTPHYSPPLPTTPHHSPPLPTTPHYSLLLPTTPHSPLFTPQSPK
jgi:hypothetical protein